MKVYFKSGINHILYPSISFRCGFNKPPEEWVLYGEFCIWKWQTNWGLRNE